MATVDPATLRKLGELVRELDARRERERLTKAAHVLSAAKALLILREKVRSAR